jgi:hypothetical protein
MLARVGSRNFLSREAAQRRAFYDEIRALALERYGPWVDDHLPFNLRVRSRLLRAGAYEALEGLAALEASRRPRATLVETRREGRGLVLRVDGRLRGRDGPFVFRRSGDRLIWAAPAVVRDALTDADLDATDDLHGSQTQLLLQSTTEPVEYLLPSRSTVRLVPVREPAHAVKATLDITARLSPSTAAAGSPLPAGEWSLLATLTVAGFRGNTRLRRPDGTRGVTVTSTRRGRIGTPDDARRWLPWRA